MMKFSLGIQTEARPVYRVYNKCLKKIIETTSAVVQDETTQQDSSLRLYTFGVFQIVKKIQA